MMRSRLLLAAFLLFSSAPAFALDIPVNDGFMTDAAGVLSAEDEAGIEKILSDYREATSNEIAVLIIPSLDGADIAERTVEIGRAWGVGTGENDNGILLLIAHEERKLFLATGYGLEGAVPDIVAKGIIETDIVPHFRDGNYAAGILAGVQALRMHIGGEYTAERYAEEKDTSGMWGFLLFFLFIMLQWLAAIMARTKSWWMGGIFGGAFGILLAVIISFWLAIPILVLLGLLLDYVISKNYKSRGKTKWWAGGGWGPGGGGGGGFGGFRGGSFGGGGAGGSW
ncbi:hypothetical protein A2706_00725 [Candidatus Peribacteria bacterium RIFCSPHIGHO2_01_FULL_51_35]|nr:MAG: hypothetical protein A2706_00725 [Candidatus Peribacteria bacterium RIFCSPHIGHO2_01_FULL_51_35]